MSQVIQSAPTTKQFWAAVKAVFEQHPDNEIGLRYTDKLTKTRVDGSDRRCRVAWTGKRTPTQGRKTTPASVISEAIVAELLRTTGRKIDVNPGLLPGMHGYNTCVTVYCTMAAD